MASLERSSLRIMYHVFFLDNAPLAHKAALFLLASDKAITYRALAAAKWQTDPTDSYNVWFSRNLRFLHIEQEGRDAKLIAIRDAARTLLAAIRPTVGRTVFGVSERTLKKYLKKHCAFQGLNLALCRKLVADESTFDVTLANELLGLDEEGNDVPTEPEAAELQEVLALLWFYVFVFVFV